MRRLRFKKLLGWFLLITGLIVIGWSLYSSYSVFTGKSSAPQIFKLEEEKPESLSPASSGDIQEEMKKMVEQQIRDMIPGEFLTKLFDLISWSILAGLLIIGGSRLSGLGIKLIRAYD